MGTFTDDADFDDINFDDDEFDEEERGFQRSARNRRSTLVVYSIIWILVSVGITAGIYFTAGNIIQSWMAETLDIEKRRSAGSDELPVYSMFTGKRGPQLSKFELGRARFGMTPKMIDKNVSGIRWKSSGSQYRVAMYVMDGARYEIWFKPGKKRDEAFRINYKKTFPGQSEARIFRHLKKRLGATIENTCGQGLILSERKCHAVWMHSGGIYIKATSTLVENGSGGYAMRLRMVAVDTFLKRTPFRPRIAGRNQAAGTKPSNTLPFEGAGISNDRFTGFENVLRGRNRLKPSN